MKPTLLFSKLREVFSPSDSRLTTQNFRLTTNDFRLTTPYSRLTTPHPRLIVLIISLVTLTIESTAQSCSCLSEYQYVKAHIEKNHGGFNKKIKSNSDLAYKAFTLQLENDIKKDPNNNHCIAYLKKYILYLQDHHSNITGPGSTINEDSAAAVEAFYNSPAYKNTEIIAVGNAASITHDDIQGIYTAAGNVYTVAIIKNKTADRDYAGIIIDSKTKLWTKGQVKMELKRMNDSTLEVYTYLRNHSLMYDQMPYRSGQLQLPGWAKEQSTSTAGAAIDNELIKFTILDSSTTLLSIRSFSASQYKLLDSVYQKVIPIIKKYPKLIIDVRNNGGGADQSYMALMPLIYTDPFQSDVVEYYATPANIKAYRDYDDILKKTPSARQNVFKANIDKMKMAPQYSFITMGNGQPVTVTYAKNEGYPTKVAVLYNRGCASSCESLLFEVMKSKKAIMVGENSGGYTGYGNVMTIQTPCGNNLSWTTSVYREQWKYEFVGIPPQYRIPVEESNWVEYTRGILNGNR